MARTKKPAPLSTEDVDLAKETIGAAFAATVDERCAELTKARAEVERLQQQVADAAGRLAAWNDNGTIDEKSALDAHSFAHRACFDLLKGVNTTADLAGLDRAAIDAAQRQADVTKRWLAGRNLLPAVLVDPNWRPSR